MQTPLPANPHKSKSKSTWRNIFAVIVLVMAGVTAYIPFSARTPAPEVTFTTLTGEKISSQSLRGKVVMVNFWATSCSTCVREMPDMVALYNQLHPQGLEFIAVAMQYDPPNYVLNFVETRKLPFKVVLDAQGELAKSFGNVKLTPTTFVIGKDGKIVKRYVGEPEFAGLHRLLRKALGA